ncbi:MAG: chromosome segregation protein SMC, partial [Bacteroidetes bacterium]
MEIKGFKSFADKTILNFNEGITGIIGPNGCGKSNIIDSIRWVIGEQKISSLRSENLEALVFNGSKTRSASGLAEVSLTFENNKNLLPTEFSTVTITRRFYKNGESEYRLNDVSCRLKDIHNLFMDTGVSTDSYAIIELGMVDDIIKDKENSRRRMLEQAAGITIYKTRKKEAKSKLDATEQDLNRIEDLLFEIHNQLKTLENQAKKAEKYHEIKKEYKTISIELAKAALEGFNIEYKKLQEQQDTDADEKAALDAAIATAEAKLESEKLQFLDQEKQLQAMQQAYNELLQEVRSRENDKNLAAQSLQFLKDKEQGAQQFLQKADAQLVSITDSIEATENMLADEQEKLVELQDKIENYKEQVEDKRQQYDAERAALDAVRTQMQTAQRQQFDAEKKVAVADSGIQNYQRSQQQLQEEAQQRANLQIEFTLKEQNITEELQLKKQAFTELQEHNQHTKEQILATQATLENIRAELAEENRKYDARKNEYDLLKSLVDNMEGYPESSKYLSKNWPAKAPIVSDVLYVQPQYRAAVENVLEPYLNYFVAANQAEAMQAVNLLADAKKGKANFFLLDALAQQNTTEQAAPAGTIAALSVIEVDVAYLPLAKHLLGNVFIANGAEAEAIRLEKGVVLDASGKLVLGKFSLTGGSVGLFEGKKIGRAKNLEKLAEEIQQQQEVIQALKAKLQAEQSKVVAYNEQLKEQLLKQTEQEIIQLNNQLFAVKNKAENLAQANETGEKRLQEITTKLAEEIKNIADTRTLLAQLNESLAVLQQQTQQQQVQYQETEKQYNFAQAQYNDVNLQFTRLQSKLAALKQELVFKQNQMADVKQQIATNTGILATAQAEIQENTEKLAVATQALEGLLRLKEEQGKQVNSFDQSYYNKRQQIQELEATLRAQQKRKEQMDAALNTVKDRLNELKLQLAGMKERLQVEFRVNIDDVLNEERTTTASLEEITTAAEKLKKRLENMGEVNPTAIEAYQEMKKRYEFIVEQKNDLVTAKDSLLKTIQEVE